MIKALRQFVDAPGGVLGEERFERLLHTIVQGTASVIGEDFFRSLVEHLAGALDVRYTFVAEFAGRAERVCTLAFWSRDGFLDNIEYDLVGSPCEQVLAGEPQLYSERVADRFPLHAEDLRALGVESYLAIPVFDSNNRVLGHLAAMDDKPMPSRPRDMSIFRIFGVRVADDWSQALHSDP